MTAPGTFCDPPAVGLQGFPAQFAGVMDKHLASCGLMLRLPGSKFGHATLATAHALWETKRLAKGEPALFDTRSGRLTASQAGGGIRMDFPAEPAEACDAGDLANALGSEVVWCCFCRCCCLCCYCILLVQVVIVDF